LPFLANGHGRYMTVRYTRTGTFVRWGMTVKDNRYKILTVSILKRVRNSRFTSETAARRF
jgi:hypothetical protein